MAIKNKNGWVAIAFVVLLSLIILLTSYSFSFQLLLNEELTTDEICRTEQYKIFKTVKDDLMFILSLNPLAIDLYNFQKSLVPFIAIPQVAALYNKVLKIRLNLQRLQNLAIKTMNASLNFQAFQLYIKLKKNYSQLSKQNRNFFIKNYQIVFEKDLRLAIKKRADFIFPPYDLLPDFTTAQALKYVIFNNNQSLSNSLTNETFRQVKTCGASLIYKNDRGFNITYLKKSMSKDMW